MGRRVGQIRLAEALGALDAGGRPRTEAIAKPKQLDAFDVG
jgi:hypothetical protein